MGRRRGRLAPYSEYQRQTERNIPVFIAELL
jgi:hypothetical protein